ncbi:hypothetical protein ACL02T_32180 [Pseudonocardia sp. RS010]|uniref:hypothetical protein n=1 Tax=Pseudonocardia sp. RS010 TaxID=3385979 RepID=UPI0039A3CA09
MPFGSHCSPGERSALARAASYTSWSQTEDRAARTAPARRAALARFEAQVDPDGTLQEAERARRAEAAMRAHMAAIAAKSAKVRRQRREQREAAA